MKNEAMCSNRTTAADDLTDTVSCVSPKTALVRLIESAFCAWGSSIDKNFVEKQVQNWWNQFSVELSPREFAVSVTLAIQHCFQINQSPPENLLPLTFQCLRALTPIKEDELDKILEIEMWHLQAYYHPNNPRHIFPWLKACFNDTPTSALYFQIFDLNREQEMRSIVFDAEGATRSCFWEGELRYRAMRIVDWFLRRYDLSAAFAVLKTLTFNRPNPNETIKRGVGQNCLRRTWRMLLLSIFLIVFLIAPETGLMEQWWPELAASIQWLPLLHRYGTPWSDADSIVTWDLLIYPLASASLVVTGAFVFWNWHERRVENLRRLLPRLLGGILVGYLPLISDSDPWKWLFQMQLAPGAALWMFIPLASVGYLYVEARNAVTEGKLSQPMRKELWIRVFQVFLIGLAEALIVGLVLCELFGETVVLGLLDELTNTQIVAVTGWIGYLFPKAILLYAPFALFLGILVQLIWDDKTVTQPL